MSSEIASAGSNGPSLPAGSIDLDDLFEGDRLSGVQRAALGLAALSIVLDGLDNQLLGFIIPALIPEWGLPKSAFGVVIASSLIAMSVGTALAGRLGDRFGRRPALIASVIVFGLFTLASSLANNLETLAVLRCIAALGLGGAMPNATAIFAEFAPRRRRSMIVSLGIVCVPVGGVLGGVLAAAVLPSFGWRALVVIGGLIPLVSAALMAAKLPESPRFLLRQSGMRDRLVEIIKRHDPAIDTTGDFARADDAPGARPSRSLLEASIRRDTLVLWGAFLACLLAVYLMLNWAPTMIAESGKGLATASSGLAAFNLGGIAGAVLGAFAMDRLGSRVPIVTAALVGAVATYGVLLALPTPGGGILVLAMAIQGAFVQGLQIMLFALAAGVYSDDQRASGVGAALAVGRFGAVASSVAGAAMLAMGSAGFLILVAASTAASGLLLMLLSRHLKPLAR